MPIEFRKGDLFSSGADALVNTVNCKGVMGGGIALLFRETFPEYYQKYKRECSKENEKIGQIGWYQIEKDLSILNFPTKDHYSAPSKISYIESGLKDLHRLLNEFRTEYFKTVAIPALGCGLGGLDWNDVKPLIEKELCDLDNNIMVYEPL